MPRISALKTVKYLLMTCDSMIPGGGDLRCYEKGIVVMGPFVTIVQSLFAGALGLKRRSFESFAAALGWILIGKAHLGGRCRPMEKVFDRSRRSIRIVMVVPSDCAASNPVSGNARNDWFLWIRNTPSLRILRVRLQEGRSVRTKLRAEIAQLKLEAT
jgi:hypothetical protein